MLFWYDDFDQAIPWLEHAARWSEERGDEVGVAVAEFHLMMLEWFVGNRDAAESHRLIADRVFRDQGMDNFDAWLEWAHGLFALGRGELADGEDTPSRRWRSHNRIGDVLIATWGELLVASADLWLEDPVGRPRSSTARTTGTLSRTDLGFWGSLTLPLWSIDIEALIALNRPDEAQPVLDDLLARAHRSGNPNADWVAERSRGLY